MVPESPQGTLFSLYFVGSVGRICCNSHALFLSSTPQPLALWLCPARPLCTWFLTTADPVQEVKTPTRLRKLEVQGHLQLPTVPNSHSQCPPSTPRNFTLSLHFYCHYFHAGPLLSLSLLVKHTFLSWEADHITVLPDSSMAPCRARRRRLPLAWRVGCCLVWLPPPASPRLPAPLTLCSGRTECTTCESEPDVGLQVLQNMLSLSL